MGASYIYATLHARGSILLDDTHELEDMPRDDARRLDARTHTQDTRHAAGHHGVYS